jgi:DNA polymerase-3 subunit delta'
LKPDGAIELARTGRLYPSLILHGAEEAGRQRLAIEIARALLCERDQSERPCDECNHCRRIVWPRGEDTFHPDFSVLLRDLRTVTSVGASKAFLRAVQVAPFEARGQVFVIANAETLSGEAANSLLKTLEEPPPSAPRHFLLLAPSQLDLLPTLRSRSLSLFLGTSPRPRGEKIESLATDFEAAVVAYRSSGNKAELLAAAAILKQSGSWKDPRASEPWERAAAVVVEASKTIHSGSRERQHLLALAADLLEGPQMRVRGIQPERILEGIVSARME